MLNLKLTLDGKIASVNTIYRRGKYGGTFLAPEVKAYREEVFPQVQDAYAKCKNKYEGGLIVAVVHVHTQFFTKGGEVKVLDIDNFAKQIIDSVFPPLGINDKMIFDLRLRKVQYDGQPKCEIRLKEIPGTSTKDLTRTRKEKSKANK